MARLPYLIPYDPDFLGDGFRVPLPIPACHGKLVQSGRVFDYIHFSLVMHRDRRIALYTAHNIDVAQRRSVKRNDDWDLDTRVESNQQTGASAYYNNPWDRGHLVRRAAVAWGSSQEALDASDSSFYYTNAAPQHEKFNRDEWVALEDWVLEQAGDVASSLSVVTGPLYTMKDPFEGSVRIPSAFFKVVVLRDPTADGGDLAALGFMMKQNELWDDWNGASTIDFQTYQVGIREIGQYTGLDFGELATLDEFEWRQARFRDRSRMKPVRIRGAADIRFNGDRRRERGIRALRYGAGGDDGHGAGSGLRSDRPGCRCSRSEGTVDDRVDVLTQQVDALKDVVDALLADDPQRSAQDRRAALRAASMSYIRIVGGEAAASNEFKECACIGGNGSWFCSGVLVHERVVLTAAHCAGQIAEVFIGGQSIALLNQGEVISVEQTIVHPDYDDWAVPSHDIAVLILEKAAKSAPVQIASTDLINAEDNAMLVGFGYEHPTENIGFGTKRKVDVPMPTIDAMTPADIDALEAEHGLDVRYEVFAGRKKLGKDSCNGDSGGPAYIMHDGKFVVGALTSRAAWSAEKRCGDGGIYTRIAPYLPWIHNVTGGLVGAAEGDPDVPAAEPVPQSKLYISAAQPNPAGPDEGKEWVEIANAGPGSVSLDGYHIEDKQRGAQDLDGVISSGSVRRIYVLKGGPIRLANAGDEIALYDGDQELHRVAYKSAASGAVIQFQPPDIGEGPPPPAPPGGCPGNGEKPPLIDADPC